MTLCKVPIEPVRYVQSSVYSQREEVMRGDGFRFARSLQHEQLWEDCNRLEPDGERP